MAKREPTPQSATGPHVTLRQAVRPVVVAHGILSSQQRAASALADEAKALCDITEQLLRELGRVHLLTASAPVVDGPADADLADRLVAAYAQAGMSWAAVLGSVTTLAELLIGEHNWATAGLLARLMAETGETAVAAHIDSAVGEARDALFREQVAAIRTHPTMTAAEIRKAVAELRALPAHPNRTAVIRSKREDLYGSARQLYSASTMAADTAGKAKLLVLDLEAREQNIEKYPSLADDETRGLPETRLLPAILALLDLCGA